MSTDPTTTGKPQVVRQAVPENANEEERLMPISDSDFAALVRRVQEIENVIGGNLSLTSVAVHNNKGVSTGSFNGGDDKTAASLYLANQTSQNQIHIDGSGVIGADDAQGHRTVNIDGNAGSISSGSVSSGSISGGSVSIKNNRGVSTGSFNGGDDKTAASLYLANQTSQNQIHIDGSGVIGADDAQGHRTVNIDGNAGQISTPTLEAQLTRTHVLQVHGVPNGVGGLIQMISEDNTVGVTITDQDILIPNGDIAEQFEIDGLPEFFEPGTVVVLCDDRTIKPSSMAYDKRVGGVVAGGGSYHPGLVLDGRTHQAPAVAVSCLGKAYCKADATGAPIEVGDLLTSSPNPGYAMRAIDPQRAFGSVIGKALQPLPIGRDLIPILICLG